MRWMYVRHAHACVKLAKAGSTQAQAAEAGAAFKYQHQKFVVRSSSIVIMHSNPHLDECEKNIARNRAVMAEVNLKHAVNQLADDCKPKRRQVQRSNRVMRPKTKTPQRCVGSRSHEFSRGRQAKCNIQRAVVDFAFTTDRVQMSIQMTM